jgi:hypothetical protein
MAGKTEPAPSGGNEQVLWNALIFERLGDEELFVPPPFDAEKYASDSGDRLSMPTGFALADNGSIWFERHILYSRFQGDRLENPLVAEHIYLASGQNT